MPGFSTVPPLLSGTQWELPVQRDLFSQTGGTLFQFLESQVEAGKYSYKGRHISVMKLCRLELDTQLDRWLVYCFRPINNSWCQFLLTLYVLMY